MIKKIDASKVSGLPASLQDPEGGIRCGYVSADREYRIPGLGDPNVPESSSVFVLDVTAPQAPRVVRKLKSGLLVGEVEDGIASFGASHPNAVAIGARAAYVSNGNNDSVSIVDTTTLEVVRTVPLAIFRGKDSSLKGLQPVAVTLSRDEKWLYVAEAGINAVAVLSLAGFDAKVEGHIPVGWWPSSVKVTADGGRLFVASAKGRGAPPNTVGEVADPNGHPKHSVFGTVNVIDVPDAVTLASYTEQVMRNNGFVELPASPPDPGCAATRSGTWCSSPRRTSRTISSWATSSAPGAASRPTGIRATPLATTVPPTTTSWPCSSPSAITSTSNRQSLPTVTAG
jgi:YVTN family beta-propeller protein